MKAVLYFPLAYLADVHGFILLAPYLVIFLAVVRTAQVTQGARFKSQKSNDDIRMTKQNPLAVAVVLVR